MLHPYVIFFLFTSLFILFYLHIEQAILEEHVVLRGQANASAEKILEGCTLLKERVDNLFARANQRCFDKVRED